MVPRALFNVSAFHQFNFLWVISFGREIWRHPKISVNAPDHRLEHLLTSQASQVLKISSN